MIETFLIYKSEYDGETYRIAHFFEKIEDIDWVMSQLCEITNNIYQKIFVGGKPIPIYKSIEINNKYRLCKLVAIEKT
jgi:hypothetical protein